MDYQLEIRCPITFDRGIIVLDWTWPEKKIDCDTHFENLIVGFDSKCDEYKTLAPTAQVF